MGEDSTSNQRARRRITKMEMIKARQDRVTKLKSQGYSNTAIAQKLKISESTVRQTLKQAVEQARAINLDNVAEKLKKAVEQNKFVDVAAGAEEAFGTSPVKFRTAVALLQEQGYVVHRIKTEHVSQGKSVIVKVLVAPGMSYFDTLNLLREPVK